MQYWYAELGAPRSNITSQPPIPDGQARYISMLGSLRAQLLDSNDRQMERTRSRVDWRRITLARKIMTERREKRAHALMMEQQARREREASLLNRSMPVRMPVNYRRLIPSDIIRQVPFGNHPFDVPPASGANIVQIVNAERLRLFSPLEMRAPQLANIFNVPYSSSRVRERALRAGRRSGTGRLITTSPMSGRLQSESSRVSATGMKSILTGAPRQQPYRDVKDGAIIYGRASKWSGTDSYGSGQSTASYARACRTGYTNEQRQHIGGIKGRASISPEHGRESSTESGRHGSRKHDIGVSESTGGTHTEKKKANKRSQKGNGFSVPHEGIASLRETGIVPNIILSLGSLTASQERATGSQTEDQSMRSSNNRNVPTQNGPGVHVERPDDQESSTSTESGQVVVRFEPPSVVLREASPAPSRHRTDSLMQQVMHIKEGENEISQLLNEVKNINRESERIRMSLDNGGTDRPSTLKEEDEWDGKLPTVGSITSESDMSIPEKAIPNVFIDESLMPNNLSAISPPATDLIQSAVRIGNAELELAGLVEDIHVLNKASEDIYKQRITGAAGGVDAASVEAALANIVVTDIEQTGREQNAIVDTDTGTEGTLPTMQPNVVVWKASVSQPHTPPQQLTKSFVDIEHAEKEIASLAEEIHNLNKASEEIYERRLSKDIAEADKAGVQKGDGEKDAFLPSTTTRAGETVSAVDTRIMIINEDQSDDSDYEDTEPQKRAQSASTSRHYTKISDQDVAASSKTSLTYPNVVVWKASVSQPHTPPQNLIKSFVDIEHAEQEIASLAQEIEVLNRSSEDIYKKRLSGEMTPSAMTIGSGSSSDE